MGAEKSKYQSDPWEPDAKGGGVEQKAADDYTKVYGDSNYTQPESPPTSTKVIDGKEVSGTEDKNGGWTSDDGTLYMPKSGTIEHVSMTVPSVAMAYSIAPDLIPTDPDSSGDSGTQPPLPDYASFTVNLGELRATEQTFLDSTATIISHYDALHTRVTDAINNPNLFGQNAGVSTTLDQFSGGTSLTNSHWIADENAAGGAETAASTNLRMTQILQSIAGLTEAMGVFTARLNNAGQLYADTDAKQSLL